jgi:hypothetical protein
MQGACDIDGDKLRLSRSAKPSWALGKPYSRCPTGSSIGPCGTWPVPRLAGGSSDGLSLWGDQACILPYWAATPKSRLPFPHHLRLLPLNRGENSNGDGSFWSLDGSNRGQQGHGSPPWSPRPDLCLKGQPPTLTHCHFCAQEGRRGLAPSPLPLLPLPVAGGWETLCGEVPRRPRW